MYELNQQEPSQEEKIKMMRLSEQYLENSNGYWTKEENERLSKMFHAGMGVSAMALNLRRSERTVMHQLNVLKLYGFKNCRRQPEDDNSCLCTRCRHYAACELRKQADPSQPMTCVEQ